MVSNHLKHTQIKTIIWDVGGVLVRTEDRHPRASLAGSLGMTSTELSHLVFDGEAGRAYQHGEITAGQYWEHVCQQLNLRPDEVPAFRAAFFGGDVLDRELVEYIRSLRPSYITAILSNMGDNLRPLLEDEWKIADAFDHIVISAEVGVMKPDPRIYQIAIERAGIAPDEAVFIDDFQHNIEGAQKVGINGILFQNREQTIQSLEKLLST